MARKSLGSGRTLERLAFLRSAAVDRTLSRVSAAYHAFTPAMYCASINYQQAESPEIKQRMQNVSSPHPLFHLPLLLLMLGIQFELAIISTRKVNARAKTWKVNHGDEHTIQSQFQGEVY